MSKTKYTFIVPAHCNVSEYSVESSWDAEDATEIAEDAGKEYYHEHDGWEASWPLDFEIFSEGKSLGVFTVTQEAEPTFSAEAK